jgi:hypothetical protein
MSINGRSIYIDCWLMLEPIGRRVGLGVVCDPTAILWNLEHARSLNKTLIYIEKNSNPNTFDPESQLGRVGSTLACRLESPRSKSWRESCKFSAIFATRVLKFVWTWERFKTCIFICVACMQGLENWGLWFRSF